MLSMFYDTLPSCPSFQVVKNQVVKARKKPNLPWWEHLLEAEVGGKVVQDRESRKATGLTETSFFKNLSSVLGCLAANLNGLRRGLSPIQGSDVVASLLPMPDPWKELYLPSLHCGLHVCDAWQMQKLRECGTIARKHAIFLVFLLQFPDSRSFRTISLIYLGSGSSFAL